MITARKFLHLANILDSIDEIPGLRDGTHRGQPVSADERQRLFRLDPIGFARRADDATLALLWAEVERRDKSGWP